jgi:outer membrane immunogenic protein
MGTRLRHRDRHGHRAALRVEPDRLGQSERGPGGVAFASIKEHDVVAATGAFTDNSATRTGWTLGAGLDYALTDRWIGRVEYRYANFGTFSYNTAVFGPALFSESHKTTENAFRLGLGYKFW